MAEGVKRYWVEEGPCECKQDGNDAMGGTFVYLESDVLQMRLDYATLEAERDRPKARVEELEELARKQEIDCL